MFVKHLLYTFHSESLVHYCRFAWDLFHVTTLLCVYSSTFHSHFLVLCVESKYYCRSYTIFVFVLVFDHVFFFKFVKFCVYNFVLLVKLVVHTIFDASATFQQWKWTQIETIFLDFPNHFSFTPFYLTGEFLNIRWTSIFCFLKPHKQTNKKIGKNPTTNSHSKMIQLQNTGCSSNSWCYRSAESSQNNFGVNWFGCGIVSSWSFKGMNQNNSSLLWTHSHPYTQLFLVFLWILHTWQAQFNTTSVE